jgi:tetratricopeptide (TPR) repeat protein
VSRGGAATRALFLAVCLGAGACATVPEKPAATTEAAPTPRVVAPPRPAPAPDPLAALVARHRQRAMALEADGQLRRALEEWKVLLTIDPKDAAAQKSMKALEGRIEEKVTERIEAGKAALARGVQLEARHDFLAALALDPGNRVAFQALQTEAREVEFVNHTVRAGDTLASLALAYYGDRSRLEVIWETNHLPPNPRLVPGTTLKIPEIPGVPFIHPGARRPATATPVSIPPAVAEPAVPKPEGAKEEAAPEMVNPLLVEAREALERKDFGEALSGVDKFLAGSPGNQDGIALKKQALYLQGKTQLSERRYEDSYRALTQLARLQPDYEDSPALLKQARASAIEQHYREGVRLYREEKPAEAIAQWRVVLELDPQNANARRNIDQAERLLKALEERKKK